MSFHSLSAAVRTRPPTVSRGLSLAVQWVLDQLLPPFLRDSRLVMWLPLRLVLGRHAATFERFKDEAFTMSATEFADVYRSISDVSVLQGDTDLNDGCLAALLADVPVGPVLELGCGRGLLAGALAAGGRQVTACDIVVGSETRGRYPDVEFREANVERLPFEDGAFENVVCTHVLEHVQDLPAALAEMRRVCAGRLFIVVPKQRPYLYGFNLHLHFFPYRWSLIGAFRGSADVLIRDLGDWYYVESVVRA
jgi:ubiquinone/menaquinone biosynthesis C-methylase UbiE